jgi:acyl-CoA synthetase (AMP-forming)/AMP-acid ligase II
MILADPQRTRRFVDKGWWGTQTLNDLFVANALEFPEREAVVDPPNREQLTGGVARRLTWGALALEVERVTAILHGLGLRKDMIIAVQLINSVEQYIVYLASLRLGLIVMPIAVQFREHELRHVLALTRAQAVVTATRIGKHAPAHMWAELASSNSHLQHLLCFGDTSELNGVISLDSLLGLPIDLTPSKAYVASITIDANDIATLCWTSGTESQPKAVPRSHNEWLIVAPSVIEAADLAPGCRLLNPFPLINMAGWATCIAAWLRLGATVVQHHPFDLNVFLAQLRQERIDYTVMPPTILNTLLQDESLLAGIDFKRLRSIGSGAAPLTAKMVSTWLTNHGVQIINYFGSNEGAALTGSPKDIPDPALRATYFPRAGVLGYDWNVSTAGKISTRLVDPDTEQEVSTPGIPAELRVAGPTIFSGYFRAPELSANAFDAAGFYRTGDLFEIAGEQQQFYKFVGRCKDLVVRGGMKISAEEVEGLIHSHPAVREVAVVGLADDRLGERICACVVLKPAASLRLDELVKFLHETAKIAVYKIPEKLVLLEALPRNPVGKILKRELRARFQFNAVSDGDTR